MNINLTLLGQTIGFALFVWFCMKLVWPPLRDALHERQKKIADGLAAAERGEHEEELARQRGEETLREAKAQASEIIENAQKRGNEIVEESKESARSEAERIKQSAQAEIDREVTQAREHLRGQVVAIALSGAEKVLRSEVDQDKHARVLDELVEEL
ncbi:F0F1 ATP synthase subunit B [Halofilum ochraceum]|jgi:F-type H+-transporting ATPase subunit b|uniref:F0F1 ATP synthase subunit B n=1 Tax=Halofilum ochraceum TaxID=1611323 RepID=UPI0008DAA6E4|nr:F0F1 ATP synthase subunit B [Halofilum ochraceum]